MDLERAWCCDYVVAYVVIAALLVLHLLSFRNLIVYFAVLTPIIIFLHLAVRVSYTVAIITRWRRWRHQRREKESAKTREVLQRARSIYREEMMTPD